MPDGAADLREFNSSLQLSLVTKNSLTLLKEFYWCEDKSSLSVTINKILFTRSLISETMKIFKIE